MRSRPAPGVAVAGKITVQTTVTAGNGHGWISRWNYLLKGTRSAKNSIAWSGILINLLSTKFLEKKNTLWLCGKGIFIYRECFGNQHAVLQAEEKNWIDAETMKYGIS